MRAVGQKLVGLNPDARGRNPGEFGPMQSLEERPGNLAGGQGASSVDHLTGDSGTWVGVNKTDGVCQ